MTALASPQLGGRGRVLHVSRVAHLGGVERIILTLAGAMEDNGYHSEIGAPAGGDLAAEAGRRGIDFVALSIDRTRISADPRSLSQSAARFLSGPGAIAVHCREAGVQLLHVHHPVGALYAARARKTLGIPLLLHVHEIGPAKLLYRLALRRAVGIADHVVAVAAPCADLALAAGADPGRLDVIHNGVDPILDAGANDAVAAELSGSGPHIGVFGVIEPRKGQDVILAAVPKVLAAFPEAKFWIVGGLALEEKADYRDSLLSQAAAYGDHVQFVGHQRDVAPWMRGMDVVALPSVALESLPTVLIEAMTLGRPVVASVIGGTPEMIADGETGRLVAKGDPTELAAAIVSLLGPAGRTIGENARRSALEQFSSTTFADRMAQVYDRLLQPRRG